MKKILVMLLAASALFAVLAGCGADDASMAETDAPEISTAEPETQAPASAPIALIGGNDEPFTEACREALADWCDANDMDWAGYEPEKDTADARVVAVARAIADGADVIILPGSVFGEVLDTVMEVYPQIRFIALDVSEEDMAKEPASNTACLMFNRAQAGFLAGYAAVREGYTELGFLGDDTRAAARYGCGFVQGADAAAAELGVDIRIRYSCGQISDDSGLTAEAEHWYQEDTEVIFAWGAAETAALKAAKSKEGRLIGSGAETDSGYYLTAPVMVPGNAVKAVLEALYGDEWDVWCGKITTADGVCAGLDTEIWTMERFTVHDYELVKVQLEAGTIAAEDTALLPEISERTTLMQNED